MTNQINKTTKYDYEMWENVNDTKLNKQKMLREISNDDLTPKKHDFHIQNEIHERIRNDEDYDDWNYGTEPIYGM
jgi:hypothetical protein